jgi:hypothetical protein
MRLMARALLLAAALATTPACLHTDTMVEQGQAPTTGNAEYDAFFKSVVELRAQTQDAETAEHAARADLAKSLGLPDKTDQEKMLEAAHERAKQLKDNGISLHLQITPEPKMIKVEGTIPLDAPNQAIVDAVEKSAKSSIELSAKLGVLPDRAAELEKKRTELAAQTNTVFKTAKTAQRREVEKELEGAADVLDESSRTSTKFAGMASKFVLDLAQAVETGGAAAALAAAGKGPGVAAAGKAPAKWKPPAKGTWKPPPAKPATPTTPPATPPKPPPKKPPAGDDFDP